MTCPGWQWHKIGYRWSPVRALPVVPLWCDLGFFTNSRDNKAAANLCIFCTPIRRLLRARPGVSGVRRRKQTLCPAAHPSAVASRPGLKSAARGVESKLPVQVRTPSPPSPAQARSRAARGVENILLVQLQILPSSPPRQARCRRREA